MLVSKSGPAAMKAMKALKAMKVMKTVRSLTERQKMNLRQVKSMLAIYRREIKKCEKKKASYQKKLDAIPEYYQRLKDKYLGKKVSLRLNARPNVGD